MPAVMGTKFNKVRVFMDKYGNIKKGGIEDNMGHDLGRAPVSDRLPGEAEEAKN